MPNIFGEQSVTRKSSAKKKAKEKFIGKPLLFQNQRKNTQLFALKKKHESLLWIWFFNIDLPSDQSRSAFLRGTTSAIPFAKRKSVRTSIWRRCIWNNIVRACPLCLWQIVAGYHKNEANQCNLHFGWGTQTDLLVRLNAHVLYLAARSPNYCVSLKRPFSNKPVL